MSLSFPNFVWKHFSLNMIRHLGPFANNFNLLLQGHFSYQWFASGLSILNRHEVNRNLEPKEKRCITYRFRIVYLMCLLRCIIREEVVLPGRRKLFPMWIYLLLVITGWVLLSCIAKQDRIFFFLRNLSLFVSYCSESRGTNSGQHSSLMVHCCPWRYFSDGPQNVWKLFHYLVSSR